MDYQVKFTPNLSLALLPANYRIWAQIMNDNLTTLDAAINGFVQFSNLRGAWANSTHYAVGDTVVDDTTAVLWTALIDHTSAQIPTTFAEDSLAHPGTWILATAPATQRGVWSGPGTAYNVGDFVLADGVKFGFCNVQHVSGASFDADTALGYWTVLVDLSIAGSQVLPILSGPADAQKFVVVDDVGTAYVIVSGTGAMDRLQGILPVLKGGTGVNTSTGTGSNVLNTSPVFAGAPTTVTPPAGDNTPTIVNAEWVRLQNYMNAGAVSAIYAPINSPNFNGVPTAPTPSVPNSNNNTIPNTAWVTAALAGGGASISVGTSPPGSPTANALWWNNDGVTGGGQLYIYYVDPSGLPGQWVPAAAGASAPTSPGGDFCATFSGTVAINTSALTTVVPTTITTGNSGTWYSTANGRYTPPAGRYDIFGSLHGTSTSGASSLALAIFKNGTQVNGTLSILYLSVVNAQGTVNAQATLDANGTDYFELRAQCLGTSATAQDIVFGAFPISGVKGPPGDPGVGLLQTVSFQTGASATGTTVIPFDDTIPQISEGNEYMTCAITPRSATSKLIIKAVWNGCFSSAGGTALIAALFQDSTANALAAAIQNAPGSSGQMQVVLRHTMTSGTTSATTFRIRAGCPSAGTVTFNGQSGGRIFGGVMASSIVIQEVQ